MKKINKEEIILLLKTEGALKLADIRNHLHAETNSTVLYHLNYLIQHGIIKKNLDKKYKLVDVADGFFPERVETIRIPLITAKAGPNDNYIEETISTGELEKGVTSYTPENLIMVKVDGDSMYPTFSNGDLLLFRKSTNLPRNGDIVLWRVDDGAKIKRFQWKVNSEGVPYGLLLSDNTKMPENTPIEINDANSALIGSFLSVIKSA